MRKNTVTASVANTPSSKISEMKMILSTDANKNKCILLVEGSDDRKFYGRFINDTNIVIDVLGSCYYMPNILSLSLEDIKLKNKVIGIKDADFDHITRKVFDQTNLFITDTHDWETMVMTRELERKVSIEELERHEYGLFDQVLTHLENYSYIKLYNETEILGKNLDGILFQSINFSSFYDGEKSCELMSCLKAVKAYGNNERLPHFPTEQDIEKTKAKYPFLDGRQLTCGHDVINGIIRRFNKLQGHCSTVGYKNLELIFRVSYTKKEFETTQLYQDIDNWAKSHGILVWVT